MKKGKTGIPISLGIASVWFGTHAGPGVASGKQIATFYSVFGKWGLLTPLVSMSLMGLCVYYSIEYARMTGAKNFKELTDKLFYPYEKVFSSFFEFTFLATVLMVLGGCIATGASILNQYLDLPILTATIILISVTILLSMYGSNLVRASSTVMAAFIIISLGIIVVIGLLSPRSSLGSHWQTSSFGDLSPWTPIMMAVVYTGFQSAGIIANAISVADGLRDKSESKRAVLMGFSLNGLLLTAIGLMLFAYPESSLELMPNYYVVEKLGNPILLFSYVLMVLLAVITTTVSFAFSVVARYGEFLPMEAGRKRDFIITSILLVLTVLVSLVGLDAIVGQGYKYLGYTCIPVVVLPIILVGAKKTRELNQKIN